MATLTIISVEEAMSRSSGTSRGVVLTCCHHTVFETASRDGRFYGRCKLCESKTWLPAAPYDDMMAEHMDRRQLSLTPRQKDADYLEFIYEKSLR